MVRSVAGHRVAVRLAWLAAGLAACVLLGFVIGLTRPRTTSTDLVRDDA